MRLIDADALIEQMEEDMEQMEEPLAKMFTGAAISDIKHAPTVEHPDINVGNIGTISRQVAIDMLDEQIELCNASLQKGVTEKDAYAIKAERASLMAYREKLECLPFVQPERKTGHWILDRSGAYCCSKCMEPCAGYVMMKPRDKFCKMCGNRNEVTE